jgi:NADH-quinone oxidoreductase subunit N
VSVPGLAVLSFALGVLALLVRHRPTVPWVVGVAGLGLAFVAAWRMPIGLEAAIGGEVFVTTGYLRLYLMLLAISGGVLTLVAWAAAMTRALPGVALIWFAAAATSLAVVDPLPAILMLTIGSIVPVLAGVPQGERIDAVVLGRGVRAVVVSGLLASGALALVSLAGGPLGAIPGDEPAAGPEAGALGLAVVGAAAALGLRAGSVPLHGWLGRLSEALAAPAIPIIFAWGPATLAIVMLGWSTESLLAASPPLAAERLVIGAIAIASLLLGAVAALLHDDLEHVVGYSIVSDAGVLLLALASLDPAGWAAARAWILAYVVAKSAFAAWATALSLSYGTRRISALSGWARRSPLLAGSLVVIALTAVGLPGLPAIDARARLVGLAVEPPFDLLASIGILASAAYFGRLLVAGFARPSAAVALAVDLQPAWTGALPARLSPELLGLMAVGLRRNRRPAAALAVFGLSLLGLAVAGGAFRGPALAAQAGPRVFAESTIAPLPSPPAGPAASPTPRG